MFLCKDGKKMECETTVHRCNEKTKPPFSYVILLFSSPRIRFHIVFDKMEGKEKTRIAHLSLESLNTTRKKNKEETLIY